MGLESLGRGFEWNLPLLLLLLLLQPTAIQGCRVRRKIGLLEPKHVRLLLIRLRIWLMLLALGEWGLRRRRRHRFLRSAAAHGGGHPIIQ